MLSLAYGAFSNDIQCKPGTEEIRFLFPRSVHMNTNDSDDELFRETHYARYGYDRT